MNRSTVKAFVVALLIAVFSAGLPAAAERFAKEKKSALAWLEQNQQVLGELSDRIWEFAETALQETRSSEAIAGLLEKEGFAVTRGVGGMATAFVATYGRGGPVIGILAEYDALPGISQKAAPFKDALKANAPGHGCGHNLFGAGAAGAALALRHVLADFRVPGTIKFFGCPAEETVVGKTTMAMAGVFDGLDAVIAWHPSDENRANTGSSQALNNFKVSFQGQTAHAAGDPWNGRSALDAVELLDIGLNFLREHMPPTARIHYVIPAGGGAPNVVPGSAQGWYYVREKDRVSLEPLYERVLAAVKGAALMTGTSYKIDFITGVHSLLPNLTGARVIQDNLARVGAPLFSPAEQDFARTLQAAFGKEARGMKETIEPWNEKPEFSGGSTDVAEVSRIVPTIQVNTACWPTGIPNHSWGIVACSGHAIGRKGMLAAAKVMALAAIDILGDEKLRRAMRDEFKKAMGGKPYVSPLEGQERVSDK